jgi:hypothetical protein
MSLENPLWGATKMRREYGDVSWLFSAAKSTMFPFGLIGTEWTLFIDGNMVGC